MGADPGRVEPSDALEMQRGMPRIGFQEIKLLVRERPDGGGQRLVAGPEAGGRVMRQSSRERPTA